MGYFFVSGQRGDRSGTKWTREELNGCKRGQLKESKEAAEEECISEGSLVSSVESFREVAYISTRFYETLTLDRLKECHPWKRKETSRRIIEGNIRQISPVVGDFD